MLSIHFIWFNTFCDLFSVLLVNKAWEIMYIAWSSVSSGVKFLVCGKEQFR